ncbi:MAG: helix-turn-helix transcriptional regulator [Psychromonas sp.]|nr:helix-turn-helix transcriptional regulator [Psychromonas sp.]
MHSDRYIQPAINFHQLPSEMFLIFEAFRSNTETRKHFHQWGQLQLISGGILELRALGERFLAPANHAIWVPAGVVHQSYNRKPIDYCSLNIVPELAGNLPKQACLLTVTPIIEAIVRDLRSRTIQMPETAQDKRLFKVLLDQFVSTQQIEHFLPTTRNELLKPILSALENSPADPTSLNAWAKRVHTTERTLARHCKNELGMSFTEWRLRVRYLHSLELLRKGESVKEIAFTLGYNQASPFITMFKRYAGCTPENYKLKHNI